MKDEIEGARPTTGGAGAPVTATLVAALLLAGCGSPPPPPPPPIDAGQAALRAERTTVLREPARVIFDWSAQEPGARFQGRGVARLEPTYKARLDLFLPGGETIARAALVDDDLRIPPGVPDGLIPPARLLWGAVGVVRPGSGSALLGARSVEGGRIQLRYGFPGGEEIRYLLRGGALERVELLRGEDVVETVELSLDEASRYPREAVYRNLPDFRELRITRDSWEPVEGFPADIWDPGR